MKQKIYPWLVMLCCCGQAAVCLGFTNNCSGVFFAPIAGELQIGIGSVSLYLTIVNLISGFLGPITVKYFQTRNPKVLFLFAAITSALGYMGMSRVTSAAQIYFLACLIGISTAFYSTAIIFLFVGRWFQRCTGMVMGITLSSSGLLAAAMSPVFNTIIEHIGWRSTYLYVSVPIFLLLLPSALLLKLRPEDLDLKPYGMAEGQKAKAEGNSSESQYTEIKQTSFPENRRKRIVVLACTIGFAACFLTGLSSHVPNYAIMAGLTSQTGAYMVSVMMVGNTASKLLAGIMCDMLGSKKTCALSLSLVLAGTLVFAMYKGSSIFILLAASTMIGIVFCITGVSLSTLIKDVCGMQHAGDVYAKVSMVGYIGSAVSYTAIGVSADLWGSYTPAVFTCIVLAVISLAALLGIFACSGAADKSFIE